MIQIVRKKCEYSGYLSHHFNLCRVYVQFPDSLQTNTPAVVFTGKAFERLCGHRYKLFSLHVFTLVYDCKKWWKRKKKVKYPVVYTNYHLYVVYIGKLRRGFQILFNTYWCVNRNVNGMFIVRETQTSIVTFIPLNFLLFIYSFYLAFLVNNEVQIVNCFIIPFFIV